MSDNEKVEIKESTIPKYSNSPNYKAYPGKDLEDGKTSGVSDNDTRPLVPTGLNPPVVLATGTGGDAIARPGFWRRVWLHLKRFRLFYAIALVIFLGAGLPILFLVIVPAIAQRIVDGVNLPIYSASILNATPNNVSMSLATAINVPGGLSVDLKPLTLNLFTEEAGPTDPFLQVHLPENHLKGNTSVTVTNQTVSILNLDQFENFLGKAVGSKEFTMSAAGSTTAFIGKLKAPLKFNKNVQLTGLNNLSGFSIEDAAFILPPEPDGTNLRGNATLPNPSVVTFQMGNVTLNMLMGSLNIGQARIFDVVLTPGNNTRAFEATIDLKTIISNLGSVLQSQNGSLSSGNLQVSATGNSTIINGQHIPYFENVLNNLVLSTSLPIGNVLQNSLKTFLGGKTSVLHDFLDGADMAKLKRILTT